MKRRCQNLPHLTNRRFRWDGRHMVWLRGDARTSASAAKRMVSRPPYGEPLPGRLLATLVVELKTADSRQRIRFRDGTGHRAQGQRLTVSRGDKSHPSNW